MVKCGSKAWVFRGTEEDLLDVFLRNCLPIVSFLTWISKTTLCEKCVSILLSRAIMGEKFKWLGHVLRITDYPFRPTVQGQTKSRSSPVRMRGCRFESSR